MLRAGDLVRADRIHFATDGIQTNVLLNVESDKKELGGWEMDAFTRGVYIKPGIYAYVNDFVKPSKDGSGSTLDEFVADHVFKGKSRGVSQRSILGEDDENDETKRNIQKEWFDYLDQLAFDSYSTGRSLAILPHKKLVTFGGAASCPERWPMCGNWVEDNRILKMNAAGVKRAVCQDADRAYDLVITKVAENKTPKVLSARHDPEWLGETEALMRDLHENEDLALAHGWECSWDVEEGE